MSVNLLAIRRIHMINQVVGTVSTESVFIECFFSGYNGERGRHRTKRFKTVSKVYEYLNKLDAGGWSNEEEHIQSWNAVVEFEELLPFDERHHGWVERNAAGGHSELEFEKVSD